MAFLWMEAAKCRPGSGRWIEETLDSKRGGTV